MSTGVWLFGALGGLATTTTVGALALARDLGPHFGLISETAPFKKLDLARWGDFQFGGHDIRSRSLFDEASAIDVDNRSLPATLLLEIRNDLEAIDSRIKPGTRVGCGAAIDSLADGPETHDSLKAISSRLRHDIASFKQETGVDRIVAVQLASTEPVIPHPVQESLSRMELAIQRDQRDGIQASMLYAHAALSEGAAFINFTPSHGSLCPAIRELAAREKLPYMGSDGKTGETLVKSVLAPMFRDRCLEVMSWQGYNMLGDRDGQILSQPENSEAKIKSKDHLIGDILGYRPHTEVRIDYVPSLGDLKTAWDFIHFQGFLGFKMSMQFVWQGCDAILGAPLVLDLVRFADYALKEGESGPLTHLASYFKSPLDVDVHEFSKQVKMLYRYSEERGSGK